jgi:hypothetical protein
MASLVLELQRDALTTTVSVSDLLRKALLIATKLDIPEFKTWIDDEMNGYRDQSNSKIPLYRTCIGTVIGEDQWRRRSPVMFSDSELAKLSETVVIVDAVVEIETIIQRTGKDDGHNLSVGFAPEQEKLLRDLFRVDTVRFTRTVRVEDLKRVLDAVRNEILRWSMKQEKDGILGEGMTFSQDERRKASAVHYTTHFHGSVGNVAQNAHHFSQTANAAMTPHDLAKLVADFSSHIDELSLDGRQRQRAEAQLEILKTELDGEPDPEIIMQAGRTLRNTTEGAVGSLIATGLQPSAWHWIHQVLASL